MGLILFRLEKIYYVHIGRPGFSQYLLYVETVLAICEKENVSFQNKY